MLAPKAYGGLELHPAGCLRIWEAVARIDAAAAWNLVMNQAITAYAAWLPPKAIAELYANGIPTIAGALHPPAKAVRVDGGWRITGQVPFASGCHHTQWLVMPAQEEGADTPFGVFFPRESAAILDTWHTLGMRGTGSAVYRGDGSLCAGLSHRAGGAAARPAARLRGAALSHVAVVRDHRRGCDLGRRRGRRGRRRRASLVFGQCRDGCRQFRD